MVDRVREACEACFAANNDDCSAFARAVASKVGVTLDGLANEIVQTLRDGPGWNVLPDGVAAAKSAHDGKLVMAGLKGFEHRPPRLHGHVVVIVDGPLHDNSYPSAYWGELGGPGAKDKTINWAWTFEDRDHVSYAEHNI
jgi:hypothetical protein